MLDPENIHVEQLGCNGSWPMAETKEKTSGSTQIKILLEISEDVLPLAAKIFHHKLGPQHNTF